MSDADTEHLPPETDLDEDGDGEAPAISVCISINEPDGTYRSTNTVMPGDSTDAQVARELLASLRGLAVHRGGDLAVELARLTP